jgi:DNA phosphorothioation-associated putative methyltransferase
LLAFGKQVGNRLYVHVERLSALSPEEGALVERARVHLPGDAVFNLVRIDPTTEEVAFLRYPDLGVLPFPALAESWRVHLPSCLLTRRKYSTSSNPPILHRTELILPNEHPARPTFAALTCSCQQVGLFDNPTVIGFQRNWLDLIRSKGFELEGSELVPLGNVTDHEGTPTAHFGNPEIQRHRTALSRSSISAPVQCLIRDGLLEVGTSFFDYGCGKGDDIAALAASGFDCAGWDPYFRPDADRVSAEVVNLGFVINVIEDYEERVQAMEAAYALARSVLAISAMISTNATERFAAYRDGVITSRSTFQRYYTQGELQHFIESVLGEDGYSAAPGIFYVFKDRGLEQRYLLRKAGGGLRHNRPYIAVPARQARSPVEKKQPSVARDQSPEAVALLDRLWHECLEHGRAPGVDESALAPDLKSFFGSFSKATTKCLERNDQKALKAAAEQRRADILVMLALRTFERRRQLSAIDVALAKSIKAFFGSMREADMAARQLLFSIQDQRLIEEASRAASTSGLGYMEENSHHIHTSLVPLLPPVLRVFVGCASAMAGDLAAYDLAKIHIGSGKVTLLQYDDFMGKPLPSLKQRVKVRLKDQEIDVFEYGERFESTLLFRKSRYINEDFPLFAEQLAFEEALVSVALMDDSPHGSLVSDFERRLRASRHRVDGFELARSTDVPPLDEKCGAHFSYRELVECGETWARERPSNEPKSPDTFNALCDLARAVLDPVIEYYGSVRLTYGFASPALTRKIRGRISPHLDQHASCESNRNGAPVCGRLGAAVDFIVEYENMREVASWIARNCTFDRMYLYGDDKPVHVSVGPDGAREIYEMRQVGQRRVPRKLAL